MKKLNTNHQVVRRLLERYPRGGAWMRMFLMLMIMMMSSAFAMAQGKYGFKVAGVDVTNDNYLDLTEISGVSGTVYFDPNTRTLTLDNATIEANDCSAILNETCDYLTIELIGTNNIDVTGAVGIYLKEETTIWSNSGGKLSVSNVQKITSAIFLLQFMFRSIAKNLTKEPCKDVVFILMCSMYFIA